MNTSPLGPALQSPEERALAPLHHGLGYERLAALLGAAAFFLPTGLIAVVLVGLAVAFTPYMLWKLYAAGWHGWMVAFGVVVGLPLVASRFADAASVTGLLALFAPLVLFYLYTWVLYYSVGERLSELRGARDFERERQRSLR